MEPKIKKSKTLKLVKLDANLLKHYRIDVDKIHQKKVPTEPLANDSSGVPRSIVFTSGSKIFQPLAAKHQSTDTANIHGFKFSAEQPSSSKVQDVLSEAVEYKKIKLGSNIPILTKGSKVVIARTSVNESRTSFNHIKTESSIPVVLPVRKRVIANNACNDQGSVTERICVQKVDSSSHLLVDTATTVARNKAEKIEDIELTENWEATSSKTTSGKVEGKVQPKETQNLEISALLQKLDIMDRKLDAYASNTDAKLRSIATATMGDKRLLGTVLADVSNLCVKKTDLDSVHRKIHLPLKDQERLMNLETMSLDPAFEQSLRKRFDMESNQSIYEFMRTIMRLLFRNTDRYSWSGKVAPYAKHNSACCKASDLNIIRILLDTAAEKFKVPRDVCISEAKKHYTTTMRQPT